MEKEMATHPNILAWRIARTEGSSVHGVTRVGLSDGASPSSGERTSRAAAALLKGLASAAAGLSRAEACGWQAGTRELVAGNTNFPLEASGEEFRRTPAFLFHHVFP